MIITFNSQLNENEYSPSILIGTPEEEGTIPNLKIKQDA